MAIIDRAKELAGYFVMGFPEFDLPGYPLTSACAAVGNAWRENLVKPTTEGAKDHGSDALFQWRLGRLDELKLWCKVHGDQSVPAEERWKTIRIQAAFFMFEVARDYKVLDAELKLGIKPLETMTANICDVFERPSVEGRALGWVPGAPHEANAQPGRINFAYATLEAMKGVIPAGPPNQVPVHPSVASSPAPVIPKPSIPVPPSSTLSGAITELHRLRALENVQIAIIQSHLHDLFEVLK